GHRALSQDSGTALAEAHLEELDQRGPELLEFVHRPVPQLGVIGELQSPLMVQPAHIAHQRAARGALRGWLPQQLGFIGHHNTSNSAAAPMPPPIKVDEIRPSCHLRALKETELGKLSSKSSHMRERR